MYSNLITPDKERNIIPKIEFQMRFTFTGECRHPEQQIHSCQNVGSQFLIANQKFNITYKQCQGMDWTANKGKMLFIIHSMYALFLTVSK